MSEGGKVVPARFLDGTEPGWKDNVSGRHLLADWITSPKNPYFARTIANRLWAYFLGTGLIEPVDEMVGAEGQDNDPGGEMAQAPKLLERFDKPGKGYLTEADLPRTWHLLVRRGPAGGLGFNALGDGGFNTLLFAGSAPPPQPKRGPTWFHQMDHNGDGYLSRREFLGSAELFRQIDADGDGLISLEEAMRADALARKQK